MAARGTPSKLSLKKKSRAPEAMNPPPTLFGGSSVIVISDDSDEADGGDKENRPGNISSKHKRNATNSSKSSSSKISSRRDSTILAGNLTILDSGSDEEEEKGKQRPRSLASFIRSRRPPSLQPLLESGNTGQLSWPAQSHNLNSAVDILVNITEDEAEEAGDIVTEDETNFYSCESQTGSPHNQGGVIDTWMTDITARTEKQGLLTEETTSLRLELSASTASSGLWRRTPGIGLGREEAGTPLNFRINPSGPLAPGSAAKLLFSNKKRAPQLDRRKVLAAGSSSSSSDSDRGSTPRRPVRQNHGEKTIIETSDHEEEQQQEAPLLASLSQNLTGCKLARVNSWLRSNSEDECPSPQLANVDSLLATSSSSSDCCPDSQATSCRENDGHSQGTSKACGSWADTGSQENGSQGTSKAGGSWRETTSRDMESQSGSLATSKAGGSWQYSRLTVSEATTHRATGIDSSISARTQGTSTSSRSYATAANSSLSQARVGNKAAAGGAVSPVLVSLSSRDSHGGESLPSVELPAHRDFVYGDESRLSLFRPLDQTGGSRPRSPPMRAPSGRGAATTGKKKQPAVNSRGRGKKNGGESAVVAGVVAGLSQTMSNLTIDNSVNAVRTWTAAVEQQRHLQQQEAAAAAKAVSDDGEDSFSKFISKIKLTKKSTRKKESSDEDFIVPDDELESSSDSETPELDLRERVRRRNNAATTASDRVSGAEDSPLVCLGDRIRRRQAKAATELQSSGESSPVSRPPQKPQKPRLASVNDSSSSNADSDSSCDSLPSPAVTGTVRRRANVIASDSEADDDRVGEVGSKGKQVNVDSGPESGDDGNGSFVNIYEPGSYHKVAPPDTPLDYDRIKKLLAPPSTIKPTIRRTNLTNKKKEEMVGGALGPPATPTTTLTFLSSLTLGTPINRCHPEALKYLSDFKKKKEELAKRLYHLYNKEIFEESLPADMDITWNVRLTKTAGLCYSKRYRNKFNIETRSSRIELSTKVIDSGDRLRDTLIHEMCHAASWTISGYRDGHGPLWRTWAEKAMERFPELPVIDRCHSYAIRTKYSYVCERCSYTIGRHSKSLDTDRKVCGHCHGKFRLVVNSAAASAGPKTGGKSESGAPKPPNPFALFVKENYKLYKKPGLAHKDVMVILSEKFSAVKLNK